MFPRFRAAYVRGVAQLRPCIVVHYHEISLKAGNRPLFLRQLAKNLARATADLAPVRVVQRSGRIVLDLEANEKPEAVRDRIAGGPGVANFALAYRGPSALQAMR